MVLQVCQIFYWYCKYVRYPIGIAGMSDILLVSQVWQIFYWHCGYVKHPGGIAGMSDIILVLQVCKTSSWYCRYDRQDVLESGMCNVIKKRLEKRNATRIKIKQKLHLRFGNPSFKIGRSTAVLIFSGWFPFPLFIVILILDIFL